MPKPERNQPNTSTYEDRCNEKHHNPALRENDLQRQRDYNAKQWEEKISTEKEYSSMHLQTRKHCKHSYMKAVYTFYTAQNSPSGIDNEAFRFLRDGQQIRGNKQWAAGADQSHSLATAWNSTIWNSTIFLNLTLTIFLNLTLTIFLNLVPFL